MNTADKRLARMTVRDHRDHAAEDCPDLIRQWVIWSSSEDGYWSNEDGWGERSTATVFEDQTSRLPVADHVEWVPA